MPLIAKPTPLHLACATMALSLAAYFLPLFSSSLQSAEEESKFTAEQIEFFEAEVRPLLVKRCYECHGEDVDEVEGGLSLATRADAIGGGDTGEAIVPGKPAKSLLIDSINYGELYEMPPESKMPDAEIAVLTKWVEMGAPWTPGEEASKARKKFDVQQRAAEHWAWQPVAKSAPPKVNDSNWPRDDLDRFVLKKLEKKSLAPAPETDRRTWIRRVYFDLIGLPPTLEQVSAFVSDASPEAFEKVVDQLLASPHFGERWARHWMDLTRYAETGGHEFDYPIHHAWRYRDYLIRAFNEDVSYDQLVREHIAGDLLEKPRRHATDDYDESLIGTGFWFFHEAKHAPVDVRLEEAGYFDNRIDVMSKTFLAMTISCARCHDHKFDAISTKDYYGLAGILQSSRRQWGMLDPKNEIHSTAEKIRELRSKGDALIEELQENRFAENNDVRVGDYLKAATKLVLESKESVASAAIEKLASEERLNAKRLTNWIKLLSDEAIREPEHPLFPWHHAVLKERRFNGSRLDELKRTDPGLLEDFSQVDATGIPQDWFATGEAFQSSAGNKNETPRWNPFGNSPLSTALSQTAHGGLNSPKLQGVLRSPTFELTSNHIHYRMAGQNIEVRVIIDGFDMFTANALLFRGVGFKFDSKGKFAWHRQSGDIAKYKGHRAYLEFIDHGDGWIAIDRIVQSDNQQPPVTNRFTNWLSEQKIESLDDFAKSYDKLVRAENSARATNVAHAIQNRAIQSDLRNVLLQSELIGEASKLTTKLAELKTEIGKVANGIRPPIHVQAIADGTPEDEYVFIRGNPKTLGEVAPRRLLEAIDGDSVYGGNESSGRLQLANRIASPDNPLASRVIVNRLWHHLIGRGIVSSTDNFGVLGQRPTHPELLDYLATQFVDQDWSIKSMLKRIALSSTYRMSSAASNDNSEVADPENLLLHRMQVKRLQGEAIRDSILQISGRIDRKMYGPSVPAHLTRFMEGRGKPGRSGPLDGNGRRSVYLEVRRNFLSPMMLAFDTPQPFSSVGKRNQSNVPAQALILMNDPFVIEQAKVWADKLIAADLTDTDRIEQMYQQALARPPTEIELEKSLVFVQSQSESSANEQEIWQNLCHVLMNLKEFIYIR